MCICSVVSSVKNTVAFFSKRLMFASTPHSIVGDVVKRAADTSVELHTVLEIISEHNENAS